MDYKKLIVILTAVWASILFATETRVASMAGASRYVWDNSNVFIYPSVSTLYYRSMVAELGDEGREVASQSSAWLLFANEEQTFGVTGLAVNHRSECYNRMLDYLIPLKNDVYQVDLITRLQDRNLGGHLMNIEQPKASYDLLYAKKIGKYTGGLILGRSSWSGTEAYSGEERKASSGLTEINLGLGYEPNDNIRADGALSFGIISFGSSYSIAGQDSAQEFKSNGAKKLAFDGRLFYALNEDMVIVPILKISYTGISYQYIQNSDSNATEGNSETTDILLGCGWNYQYRNHLKLIVGADIGYSKSIIEDSLIIGSPGDVKENNTLWTFPALNLALEANLTNWAIARIGATQSINSVKKILDYSDGTSSRTESSEQPYQLSMGLTLKKGNLNLDLLVNPEMLYSGGNIASGSKTWPASSAALSYRF
jgi:hypothetical protein